LRDWLLSSPPVLLQAATWGALAFELLFAPLALLRRLRPFIWGAMLVMHLGLIALIDFADLSLWMVMLSLFTFDPGWVKPIKAKAAEMIFYDGQCGLCHRFVRFALAEDGDGRAFRFAPLEGEAFRAALPEERRRALPDSLIVMRADGELLSRSAAVLHLLKRLGGGWRIAGAAAGSLPSAWLDRGYDCVARLRRQLFPAPSSACPLVPAQLRGRFEH